VSEMSGRRFRCRMPTMFEVIPTDRNARWELLRQFVARWYKTPLNERSGFDDTLLDAAERRLGVQLAPALREWYRLAGKRKDIWSVQDEFLTPDRLEIEDSVLSIYNENQYVTHWGIKTSELGKDDPPVIQMATDDSAWILANPTLSEFALQMCLFSAKFASDRGWCACGHTKNTNAVELIQRRYERAAFPKWDWVGAQFFCDNNIILEIDEAEWIWVSAQSEAHLDKLINNLGGIDIEWEDRKPRGG